MRLHGVGVDVVVVSRVARLLARDTFARRWFTEREVTRTRCSVDPRRGFAELLAAKEAAWKALRIPWEAGVPWASMEVLADGKVALDGTVSAAASAAGVGPVWTHASSDDALAMAVAAAWSRSQCGDGPVLPIPDPEKWAEIRLSS